MRSRPLPRLVVAILWVSLPLPVHGGKILISWDEWLFTPAGFTSLSDPAEFAANVAGWATPYATGSLLAYNSDTRPTLDSPAFEQAIEDEGHVYAVCSGGTLTLPILRRYDGVFLGGPNPSLSSADIELLAQYVDLGGTLIILGGYGGFAPIPDDSTAEAAYWDRLLDRFGLAFHTDYNPQAGDIPIESFHPLFDDVDHLYMIYGQSVLDQEPKNPWNQVLESQDFGTGTEGSYAAYDDGLGLPCRNQWSIQWFGCDMGHENNFSLERDGTPVCGSDNCAGAPGSCWGLPVATPYFDADPDWESGVEGGLDLSHGQDVQVYGETYLRVDDPTTVNAPYTQAMGRIWLNGVEVFEGPPNTAVLVLQPGWNHLEFTSYHQHDSTVFVLDFPFASVADQSCRIPACADGEDNDRDGFADDLDIGCVDRMDPDETERSLPCDDGIDNDDDQLVDSADPGCESSATSSEADGALEFVLNAGFEQIIAGVVFGWDQSSADVGVWNPTVEEFPGGAPGGSNAAWNSGAVQSQELSHLTLEAGVTYTLLVEVGWPETSQAFAGYELELRAGGTVLASANEPMVPCKGTFETARLSYTASVADPIGQPVEIAMSGSKAFVAFDDVRLRVSGSACTDRADNDNDGTADYPDDPGCGRPSDGSERSSLLACDDGIDNDADQLVDSADPGCESSTASSEVDGGPEFVLNAGFEEQMVAEGSAINGVVSGWDHSTADLGVWNPTVDEFPGQAPGGSNVAWNSGAVQSQELSHLTLDAGVTYTLLVEVGWPAAVTTFAGYELEIRAGGTVLASASEPVVPRVGTFETAQLSYAATVADPIGQPVEVAMSASGHFVAFDDVRLRVSGPACTDGLDNDDDGMADYPDDPGCEGPSDGSERSALLACDDGIDNDGDTYVDFAAGGAGDPGCKNAHWVLEDPECQDGVNNDLGQDPDPGLIDFDGGQSIHGLCTGIPCVAPAVWPGCGCHPAVSDLNQNGVAEPDPDCVPRLRPQPWRDKERRKVSCGLGAELVLVLGLLRLLGGHRKGGQHLRSVVDDGRRIQ